MSLESVLGRIAELTGPAPVFTSPAVTASRPQTGSVDFQRVLAQTVDAQSSGTAQPERSSAPAQPERSSAPAQPERSSAPAQGAGQAAPYDEEIRAAAAKYGVEPALVRAVIQQESGFNPKATSPAGAQGLMQLMPATARGLGVTDAYDPVQSIDAGTRYLAGQLDRFGGDVRLALAAYNAGPGAVQRYGGIPPYAETQRYVENVLAHYQEGA